MDWNLQRRLVEEGHAMQMTLNATEWDELERAQQHEHEVRNWKRYQAIRLLGQGQTPLEVAPALAAESRVSTTGSVCGSNGGVGGCMRGITAAGSDGCRRAGSRTCSVCWPLIRTNWANRPRIGRCRYCGPT
jgi:hypothetical protein